MLSSNQFTIFFQFVVVLLFVVGFPWWTFLRVFLCFPFTIIKERHSRPPTRLSISSSPDWSKGIDGPILCVLDSAAATWRTVMKALRHPTSLSSATTIIKSSRLAGAGKNVEEGSALRGELDPPLCVRLGGLQHSGNNYWLEHCCHDRHARKKNTCN